MSRTVALPVSGSGCGRCTTIRSGPFFSNTRDPERWVTSTSAAFNMVTMSAHRMPLGVGLLNTSFSVR